MSTRSKRLTFVVLTVLTLAIALCFLPKQQRPTDQTRSAAPEASSNKDTNGLASAASSEGGAGESKPTDVSAEDLKALRFRNHSQLVKTRTEVWEFQRQLHQAQAPQGAKGLFEKWALVVFREAMLTAVLNHTNDIVSQRAFLTALTASGPPDVSLTKEVGFDAIPEKRIEALLNKVARFNNDSSNIAEIVYLTSEFESVSKKAKQRSDSHYMSEMKEFLRDPQSTLDMKLKFVRSFIEIRDVTMAEYPREYFQQLLEDPSLSQDQRAKVKQIIEDATNLRRPQT